MGNIKRFFAIIQRDLAIGFQKRSELLTPLIFFLIVVSLFPLGLGLENRDALQEAAPAIIWVAALLSTMLIMERLFKEDFIDGSLEQLMISGQSLYLIVLGKIIAHWLLTALPLILFTPILSLMMLFTFKEALAIGAILAIGTPLLSLIGAMCVAIIIGARNSGLLLSILLLPLYIPILIFGTQMIIRVVEQHEVIGYYALFAGANSIAFALCPLVASFALRLSLE